MRTRSGENYKFKVLLRKKREKRVERKENELRKVTCENISAEQARRVEILNESRQVPFPTDESFDGIIAEERIKRRTMGEFLNKIEKLKMDGNLSENWRRFKRYFDIFMTAGELNEKSDAIKVSTFLNAVGEEAIEVFDTFTLTQQQRASYTEVIKAFDDFCKPKKNPVYERFVLNQRKQKEGEPFDTFLMDIKRLARTCEFGANENEMLRDRIVWGVHDQKLQLRLIEKNDLTYDQAVEMARQSESTKEQVSTMNTSKSAGIDEIRHTQNRYTRNHVNDGRNSNNNKQRDNRHRNTGGGNSNSNSNSNNNNNSSNRRNASHTQNTQHQQREQRQNSNDNENKKSVCKFCNYSHKFGTKNCPAYGKSCNICFKNNHFSSVCRQKNVSALSIDSNYDYDYDDNNEFFVSTLCEEKPTDDVQYPWIEHIAIDEKNVPFKIDTGAGVDVLPMNVLKRIVNRPELNRTEMTLRAFAGEKVKPIGTCSLICSFHGMSLRVKFAIVDFDCTPILGLKSCVRFKIVQPSRTRSRIFRNSKQNRNF